MPPDSPRVRVLVVEDEPSILENVLYALEAENMEPRGVTTGAAALDALSADGPWHIAILDIGLPDSDGFSLCREIRARSSMPIIFLTARSGVIDRVVGLEIGGDDYVVKPFSPRELAARVKAVLRRAAPTASAESAAPAAPIPFRVDSDRARVEFFGAALDLSATEFRLLAALCRSPGRVFSRSQLMNLAWDDPASAMERTVDAHIKTLRAKLHAVRPEADPIRTHRGLGYSLQEEWPAAS